MKRFAFTLIELVFVIVVLGILSAIAIPKFAATRDDAQMAKGRSDVAAIRAAIVSERQSRLLMGESKYITSLGSTFDGNGSGTPLMMYPPKMGSGNGEWTASGTSYSFKVMDTSNTFTYDPADGSFMCTSGTYCDELTK